MVCVTVAFGGLLVQGCKDMVMGRTHQVFAYRYKTGPMNLRVAQCNVCGYAQSLILGGSV